MYKKIACGTILSLAVMSAVTGCTDVQNEYQYVRLAESTISFLGADNTPRVIDIDAAPEWTAETSSSWITLSDQTTNSITVTVSDNELDEERTGKITITAGEASAEIQINQLAFDNDAPVYHYYGPYDMGTAMSPNGRYCVGTRHVLNEDNTYSMYPTFFDLQTGDVVEVGPLLNDQYSLEKPMAVTDQGTAFIYTSQNYTAAVTIDGDVFIPEVPDGANGNTANVQSVSEDGRIWVGFYYPSTGQCRPLKWVDGVPEELEMPELTYRQDRKADMCMARGMSLDGSVIYGTQWDDLTCGMVYWKDGKLQNVGKDVYRVHEETIKYSDGTWDKYNLVDGMFCFANLTQNSPDGVWIAGKYQEETVDEEGMIVVSTWPAFYNTETEKTTILKDHPGCCGMTVTNSGKAVVGTTTTMITEGFVVDLETGANLGDCLSYIKENYGITISMGVIVKFTADEKYILGSVMSSSAAGTSFTNFSVSPRP